MNNISQRIASELAVQPQQVSRAIELLDNGDTVPFIARYRKEVTGSLDDTQLRQLQERLVYLRELEDRRSTILKSIQEQEKLTPALEAKLKQAETKNQLEDIYLPYKPKRRTKAQIAREAGLAPLAEGLLKDPVQLPEEAAKAFTNKDLDIKQALEGARQILMELFSESAELRDQLREYMWANAEIISMVVKAKQAEGQKFQDYFDYQEPIKKIPSHRALALFRGRKDGVLRMSLSIEQPASGYNACEQMIADHFQIKDEKRPADAWLAQTVTWAWKVKFSLFLEMDLFSRLRESAELEAIHVFAENLKHLLLAAPAGLKCTLGLDPGYRTGVKVVVINQVGKLVEYTTIYPHAPQKKWQQALETLALLCQKHKVELISIGNGTASRETDQLASELITKQRELKLQKLVVSEAGASVYSASELAAAEFPKLDVSLRGAVSIARRLQDPLAELVKIEPKAIGVGQYQHDVSQLKLARSLDAVVEDCVNAVGVDINSASVPLLTKVSGLNRSLAANIVSFREINGAFVNREAIKKVTGLGDKTFEQAAGFLKINQGENPLDASAVHPESYPLVNRILEKLKQPIKTVIGNKALLKSLNPHDFTDEHFGLPTVKDILLELEKPGRDPRPEFKTAVFDDAIHKVSDLKPGMLLEGVVTNVTNFGAFVDIGVHQDGLVHISKLADRFVENPMDVVKAGQVVKVKVETVDVERKRIALTMRLKDDAPSNKPARKAKKQKVQQASGSAFADALAKAIN